MLTEINTSKDNRIVFAFPPDSGELAGQRYHLGLRFCDNPACRCGVIHVGLSPESSDLGADSDQAEPLPPSVEFGIDVHRRDLDAQGSRQGGVKQQLGTAFVGALSTEDWTSLRRIFYAYKRKVTDETPDDEIEATFDADDIERASTMVSFQEVLPYAERKVVDIEGRRFQLDDLYCVKSACDCTDVVLMLLELVAPSDAIHVVGEVPALCFDYRSKSWRIATSGEEDPQLLGRIAEEVATDAFMSFFQGRHARLKALYRGYQARNARRAARIAPRQSVGRNDPCPCGSGKKYKKCCLDAPQASLRA